MATHVVRPLDEQDVGARLAHAEEHQDGTGPAAIGRRPEAAELLGPDAERGGGHRLQPVGQTGSILGAHTVTPRCVLISAASSLAERISPILRPAMRPSAVTKSVCGGANA